MTDFIESYAKIDGLYTNIRTYEILIKFEQFLIIGKKRKLFAAAGQGQTC